MKYLLLTLFAFALLSLVKCAHEKAGDAPLVPVKVCVVGDSHLKAMRPHLPNREEVKIIAKNGMSFTTIPKLPSAHKYVFVLGTNDTWQGLNPSLFLEEVQNAIAPLDNAELRFIEVPRWLPDAFRTNSYLGVCGGKTIPLGPGIHPASDSIHMTRESYKRVAKKIESEL